MGPGGVSLSNKAEGAYESPARERPRIFIGIKEFGDLGIMLSRGLRELGYQATTVMVEQPENLRRPYSPDCPAWDRHDIYIRKPATRLGQVRSNTLAFLRMVKDYDIFIFLGVNSFLAPLPSRYGLDCFHFLDWRVIKAMKKDIVVFVTGSDLRSYPALLKEMTQAGLPHVPYFKEEIGEFGTPDNIQKRKARRLQAFACHIFARPNSAQYLTRPYNLYWVPVDLSQLSFSWQEPTTPLVLHAPSHREVKGTRYVLQCVDQLKRDGFSFEFRLIENMENDEVRLLLQQSHIVIDQMLLPGYGLLAIEAMAAGNVVLGSALADYNGFPESLPIITSTPDNLYDNLKNLLNDRASWADIARLGRAYVEQYHDYRKVAENLAEIILGGWPERSRAEVNGPVQKDKVARTHVETGDGPTGN